MDRNILLFAHLLVVRLRVRLVLPGVHMPGVLLGVQRETPLLLLLLEFLGHRVLCVARLVLGQVEVMARRAGDLRVVDPRLVRRLPLVLQVGEACF